MIRSAAVHALGVNPSFGPAVDRRYDHPIAVIIEEGQGERHLTAHVIEGIVPDHPDIARRAAERLCQGVLSIQEPVGSISKIGHPAHVGGDGVNQSSAFEGSLQNRQRTTGRRQTPVRSKREPQGCDSDTDRGHKERLTIHIVRRALRHPIAHQAWAFSDGA